MRQPICMLATAPERAGVTSGPAGTLQFNCGDDKSRHGKSQNKDTKEEKHQKEEQGAREEVSESTVEPQDKV